MPSCDASTSVLRSFTLSKAPAAKLPIAQTSCQSARRLGDAENVYKPPQKNADTSGTDTDLLRLRSTMVIQILVFIVGAFLTYFVVEGLRIFYKNLTSPLRTILPGPPILNYLAGNFKEIGANPNLTTEWQGIYGSTFLFHDLLSVNELYTNDLKALNHIVTKHEIYQRAHVSRDIARRIVGEGILSAELDQHKRQRRVLNPAFGVAQVRLLTETFIEKSVQLRDVWASQAGVAGGTVDVLLGLREATLDIIGRAGFGYEFNALNAQAEPNELNRAFTDLFHAPNAKLYGAVRLAQSMLPVLKLLPLPGGAQLKAARIRMDTIGLQIVRTTKASLGDSVHSDKHDKMKSLSGRRDILAMLLKANMSSMENQKLSEAEVVAQIPAFFVAGHETTSIATAWALHCLSINQAAQTKLRAELSSISTDNPTLEELNSLTYLEKVVRETLRAHTPLSVIQRAAMEDDILPLSKPITGRDGKVYSGLPIRKGQLVHLPIAAVNTSTAIWGEDALEFRPERWDNIPDAATAIPSIYGNLFTFLAGPHNCVGFRFALAELKALLFTLIRAFVITPALPAGSIGPGTAGTIAQRPTVLRWPGKENINGKAKPEGLPLILTPVERNGN
ncbi:hypothetical protein HMN09_01277800 [Mycena chlorophos]|uniref:Cytochrome P450 n=1 Tax=Mycena chlorophos TaxID=658473 RepID=A0A8H6S0B9_MYCCL|nr:hypothetical protein HMN09_01277800 [Mycena chlorophos]